MGHHKNFSKIGNTVGAEGAETLSEALKVNTTLTSLNLGCVQQQQENVEQGHKKNINEHQAAGLVKKEHKS